MPDNRYHGISVLSMESKPITQAVTNVDNETATSCQLPGETLSAGDNHNCAALDNGSAMCWGR